jgi:organic hydroperoxide reductase OsmC/OhrA
MALPVYAEIEATVAAERHRSSPALEKAHARCPYSNDTRNNVSVRTVFYL